MSSPNARTGVNAYLDRARSAFRQQFGSPSPTHLSRAPGRVNLIGDHTDYNGLPVLPMAIQRAVHVVFRARTDDRLILANVDPRFAPVDMRLTETTDRGPPGHWSNYVRAAARAIVDRRPGGQGLEGVVASDIPIASGLSSSSALVVAVALALAVRNELDLPRHQAMTMLASAERYVGTEGGGMDQTIALGGVQKHACHIAFDPTTNAPTVLTPVRIPSAWAFVVASTMVDAEKSGAVQAVYNRRTVECRAAREIVAQRVGTPAATYQDLIREQPAEVLLEVAVAALEAPLFRRFRHVITEADRVERATAALQASDRAEFGRLMTASHESLRHDFEASGPELDELVAITRAAGADGARLTGAGFGGSMISLVTREQVGNVRRALVSGFYQSRGVEQSLDQHILLAEPSAGARVVVL